jgi:hypothetical protein
VVETASVNGTTEEAPARVLPDFVEITQLEMARIPSPGTQRALKAETGRDILELTGDKADNADRTQTQVWMKLRRTIPDLRWSECVEVEVQYVEGALPADPSELASSGPSPGSVGSGG